MEYNNLGKVGWVKDGVDVYTFSVGNSPINSNLAIRPITSQINGPILLTVDEFKILTKGIYNNEDEEIEQVFEENRIIPELIEKQVRIQYGRGPRPYIETFDEKSKMIRQWQRNAEIENWLESWEDNGLTSYKAAAKKILRRYYTFEEFYMKPTVRATRFVDPVERKKMGLPVPVIGFELIENKRCRLASKDNINIFEDDYEESNFTHILVGNWNRGAIRKFKRYIKLSRASLLKNSVGITHHKNDSVGKIYGMNKFYHGVKEWIIGSNLTPKNINSFVKNSMAAKVNIIVPEAWCESKRDMIKAYCEENERRITEDPTAVLIKLQKIDNSFIELGTNFNEYLFTQYFKNEIEKCVQFLSGPDNQGKTFTSISFRDDKGNESNWKFETIDLKYKEYIDALISFDKRADEVLQSSKGLPSSVSNLSKDGIISTSGSDLYYNYIIYLFNLIPAEEICMEPFNWGIYCNFPDLYAQGWRIGLYNEVPEQQQQVSPANRMANQQQAL